MDLKGKVVVVTGSAVGIGREIAIEFAKARANIVINYSKSKSEAEETLNLVRKAGGEGIVCKADVSQELEADNLIKQAVNTFGTIDILVNNAGITRFIPFTDLDQMTPAVWDLLYDVNVKGTFFCSRAAAKVMKPKGSGNIITISSQAGIRPFGSSIPYCVSKAAIIHLTKCLAISLAPEIQVNCIAPGVIEGTRWNAGQSNLEASRLANIEATPLKHLGTPGDVAKTTVFLALNSDFITGIVIPVDGGRTL